MLLWPLITSLRFVKPLRYLCIHPSLSLRNTFTVSVPFLQLPHTSAPPSCLTCHSSPFWHLDSLCLFENIHLWLPPDFMFRNFPCDRKGLWELATSVDQPPFSNTPRLTALMWPAIYKEPFSPDTFTPSYDLVVMNHGQTEAHVAHVGLYMPWLDWLQCHVWPSESLHWIDRQWKWDCSCFPAKSL